MNDPAYIRTVMFINTENRPYPFGLFDGKEQEFKYITEGVVSHCVGMPPYKGRFPDDITIGRINGAKSLISYNLFLLRTTPLSLFFLLPNQRTKFIRRTGMYLYKHLYHTWDSLKDTEYCRSSQELNRAITKVVPKDWHEQTVINYKYTFLSFWENDDHYRFLMQDLLSALDKESLKKNPKKELKRLLDLGMSRSHFEGVKKKLGDLKKLLTFVPSRFLRIPTQVIQELNMDKIRLDSEDMEWAEDKPYDFGGVPWKGREYSLSKGKNYDKIKPMENEKSLSPSELEAFNKEFGELCKKHNIEVKIKSEPQLIVVHKDEPKN